MKFATPAISLAVATGANAFSVHNSPAQVKTSSLPYPGYLADLEDAPSAGASAPETTTDYLESVQTASVRTGGAGIGSYLDTISANCDAVEPTEQCADAITGYMGALSSGDAPASSATEGAKAIGSFLDSLASQASANLSGAGIQGYLSSVATAPERSAGAGMSSYLDSVGGGSTSHLPPTQSAPAVKSYLDALSSGAAVAPAAPAVQDYLSDVSSGAASAPTSGSGIASYLASLPVSDERAGGAGIQSYLASVPQNPNQLGGGGIGTYLETVPTNPDRISGAGIGSYLDYISQACDALQPDTSECAEAISGYVSALSSGDAPAASSDEAAQHIGGYLDALATAPERAGGAGISSYMTSMTTNSAILGSASSIKSYLDSMAGSAYQAPSAVAVKDMLDSVSSGATPTGSGIANYLSSLPVTNERVGGAGITNYLESMNQACEANKPTSECAQAITTYTDALSSGVAHADSSGPAAQTIGNYIDNLASGSALSGGAGISSYLSTGSNSAIQGSSAHAVKSYLDAMSAGFTEAPSAPTVKEFLDDMSSGAANVPTSASGIASYLAALRSSSAISGGAGITSHVDTLASGSQLSGAGITGYGGAALAAAGVDVPAVVGSPSTKIDTQVSHDGLQTTITITSVTTVVIDDE